MKLKRENNDLSILFKFIFTLFFMGIGPGIGMRVFLPLQVLCFAEDHLPSTQIEATANRKELKVLVVMAQGGGGHVAAAKAIKAALEGDYGDQYDFKVTLVDLGDVLPGGKKGVEIWDKCFTSGNYFILNSMAKLNPVSDLLISSKLVGDKYIKAVIKEHNPDILFSVFLIANRALKNVAKDMQIPFIEIPTDFDPRHFFVNIKNEDDHHKMAVHLAVDDEKMNRFFKGRNLDKITTVTGYPIRKEFAEMALKIRRNDHSALEAKNKLKSEYSISEKDKIIFAVSGAKGFGENMLKEYIREIFKQEMKLLEGDRGKKIHIIAVAGKNEKLLDDFKVMAREMGEKYPNVELHPRGWTDAKDMALFMGMSDMILSKPGGSSAAEIMAVNGRALFMMNPIYHERYNAKLMQRHGWADTIRLRGNKINSLEFVRKATDFLTGKKEIGISPENVFHHIFRDKIIKTIQRPATSSTALQ